MEKNQGDLQELLDARALAGESNQSAGFATDIFLGKVRLDLIEPFPAQAEEDRQKAVEWLAQYREFLWNHVDPNRIDADGNIPDEVIDGLKKLKVFALKVPEEYGGLGFSYSNYSRAMVFTGGWCGNIGCLISPPNSLGIATPLIKIGTEWQKREFLPKLAAGEISAFALTEEDAGSDPSRIKTTATRVYENGALVGYKISGKKLYTTALIRNDGAALADYVAVFARIKKDELYGGGYGLFIVPTNAPGFKPDLRCYFMSYSAILNGVSYYNDVFIPASYLLGNEKDGFGQAKECITFARLGLPELCLGGMKQALQKARFRCASRKQWRKHIGKHQEIAAYLVEIACRTFAGEAMVGYCNALTDEGNTISLESAFAKYMLTEDSWKVHDLNVQIHGGSGVEKYFSQKRRGVLPIAVERSLRDSRVNRIFEGTNEIMKVFVMTHEGLQPYLNDYLILIGSAHALSKKLGVLWRNVKIAARSCGKIFFHMVPLTHQQFIQKQAGVLALRTIAAGLCYGASLKTNQLVTSRLCLHGMWLMSMSLTLSYAKRYCDKPFISELADYYCWMVRHDFFQERMGFRWILWGSHKNVLRLSEAIQKGELSWLEEGILSELEKEGVHVPGWPLNQA